MKGINKKRKTRPRRDEGEYGFENFHSRRAFLLSWLMANRGASRTMEGERRHKPADQRKRPAGIGSSFYERGRYKIRSPRVKNKILGSGRENPIYTQKP